MKEWFSKAENYFCSCKADDAGEKGILENIMVGTLCHDMQSRGNDVYTKKN